MQTILSNTTATDELWSRYAADRSRENRNALVVAYMHLADQQATRLARKYGRRVSFEEIRSAAFDGLLQAVESFDATRNIDFEIYCQRRISGAVMDWLRSIDQQSRTVRDFERRRATIQEQVSSACERQPTTGEMASRMGLPIDRFQTLARQSHAGCQVHFSTIESQTTSRGGDTRRWDTQDRRAPDPSQSVGRALLTEYIARGLTRDERMVLVLYYFEELTMAEIGAVLQLSESRVSQIHKDVLQRLRQRFDESAEHELIA